MVVKISTEKIWHGKKVRVWEKLGQNSWGLIPSVQKLNSKACQGGHSDCHLFSSYCDFDSRHFFLIFQLFYIEHLMTNKNSQRFYQKIFSNILWQTVGITILKSFLRCSDLICLKTGEKHKVLLILVLFPQMSLTAGLGQAKARTGTSIRCSCFSLRDSDASARTCCLPGCTVTEQVSNRCTPSWDAHAPCYFLIATWNACPFRNYLRPEISFVVNKWS